MEGQKFAIVQNKNWSIFRTIPKESQQDPKRIPKDLLFKKLVNLEGFFLDGIDWWKTRNLQSFITKKKKLANFHWFFCQRIKVKLANFTVSLLLQMLLYKTYKLLKYFLKLQIKCQRWTWNWQWLRRVSHKTKRQQKYSQNYHKNGKNTFKNDKSNVNVEWKLAKILKNWKKIASKMANQMPTLHRNWQKC